MSTPSNVEKVQALYEAFGRGDVQTILDGLAPDVTWVMQGPAGLPLFGSRRGREGAAKFFQEVAQHLAIEEFTLRQVIGQGEMVVVVGYERGKVKATGRSYEGEWAHFFTFKAGQVVAFKEFSNTAALAIAFQPAWSSCPAA